MKELTRVKNTLLDLISDGSWDVQLTILSEARDMFFFHSSFKECDTYANMLPNPLCSSQWCPLAIDFQTQLVYEICHRWNSGTESEYDKVAFEVAVNELTSRFMNNFAMSAENKNYWKDLLIDCSSVDDSCMDEHLKKSLAIHELVIVGEGEEGERIDLHWYIMYQLISSLHGCMSTAKAMGITPWYEIKSFLRKLGFFDEEYLSYVSGSLRDFPVKISIRSSTPPSTLLPGRSRDNGRK